MNERGRSERPEQLQVVDEGTHITPALSDREQVERTANRLRDELLLTLEELERRRELALDLRYQLLKHRDLLIGAAFTAAALVGVGVAVAVWRTRHRRRILSRLRLRAFRRAWEHPRRVASSAGEPPLGVALGRKVLFIFITSLAKSIAKSAERGLQPRQVVQAQSAS